LLGFLATIAYALVTWQAYLSHERFVASLTPFVGSLRQPERMLSPAALAEFAEESERLFTALCRDAIGAIRACLLLDGDPPRTVAYCWSHADLPTFPRPIPSEPLWVDEGTLLLPLADSPGPAGALFLGPKSDGTLYMAEEIQLALACGERIRDAATGEQITRTLMGLLRQRLSQLKVLSSRHKRVLHDQALPALHLALLNVETARFRPEADSLEAASRALVEAHRTIAELLREASPVINRSLSEQGVYLALREAVDRELAAEFDSVTWEIGSQVAARLAETDSGIAGEVLYYAALEAVRNAARHGRGGQPGRPLHLNIALDWSPEPEGELHLRISDDGVGLGQTPPSSNGGAGQGLLFHSTMLAVAGGRLSVNGLPGKGTRVDLSVPLRPLAAETT
ncbi:MAG: hypothetical protein HY784_03455, partial [Chloroflexi bacterium]|nr:hypothetical protein [Chloroflexota bacterium]